MKKRKWLFIGVAIAAVLQFLFEGLWSEVLFKSSYGDFQPIQRMSPLLFYNFLSETFFALVIGFFYLHVPNERRSLKTGATIGSILGLLIALYQYFDWYGSFNVSFGIIVLEIIKTIILAAICGVVISFTELKLNPRTKPGAA
jgi:hypothetical protein